ncbi:MAG TPA: hypothetical protein VMY76_11560 [Gemmatimonadales bacterium]|nr:hypothetical protein [Gemmatimonadales bacterium]
MTDATRFVCSDPDAGDFEFADVEAVLDALEAALIQPSTPIFDAARQSWQPAGLHPEIRAAWEARLRFRPAPPAGLELPELPSMTALVRSLPDDSDERQRRREAYARIRSPLPAVLRPSSGEGAPRFAAFGVAWAVAILALVAWGVLVFASRLTEFAATAAGLAGRK